MTSRKLKEVLERVENWPARRQEAAARVLIQMEEQDTSGYRLSDDQVAEVKRRRANPNRKFVTLAEVRKRLDRR